MDGLLQIAYNNERRIVSVYEVETGIKCNCFCPECGEKLEAKNKGKKENTILMPNQKVAHFAHVSGKVCKYAAETALHKLAKSVLLEGKKLLLPVYEIWGVQLADEICVEFDTVQLEQSISNKEVRFVPDAIVQKGQNKLLVEFYKSHIVDVLKLEKIKTLGFSAIEIDINSIEPIKNGLPNREDMRNFLEKECDFSNWLYNKKRDRLYAKKNEEAKIKEIEREKRELVERKQQEEKAKIYQEKSKRDKENKKVKLERIEAWKDEQVKLGYDLIKVYAFGQRYEKEDTVFCPNKPYKKNKVELFHCRLCVHHLNLYFSNIDEKKVLCGFRSNLSPNNRQVID